MDEPAEYRADAWSALRRHTRARIALGRTGNAMRTMDVLDFDLACARARDAVHRPLDVTALRDSLAPLTVMELSSRIVDRSEYLRHPDRGRLLSDDSVARLTRMAPTPGPDIAIIVGDGLSSSAPQAHAAPVIHALRHLLAELHFSPVIIARQARVAIADDIGERLGARLSIILIGERPGLSSLSSLGAYLTYAPRVGRKDSEKNCVSNIHDQGLSPEDAARKLAWLAREALSRKLSGVDLTDDEDGTTRLPVV